MFLNTFFFQSQKSAKFFLTKQKKIKRNNKIYNFFFSGLKEVELVGNVQLKVFLVAGQFRPRVWLN